MKDQGSSKRLFGCFLTVPLGCMAFFVGAVVVAVGMMPVACGRLIGDTVEDEFHATFEGVLDLDEVRLPSFHSEQRLALTLLDPGGDLVASGRLKSPPFPVGSKPEVWGPVEIRLDRVHVRVDEEGLTSIERAFAPRSEEPRTSRLDFESDSFEELRAIDLVFSIEELAWTDTRGEGRSFVLADVSGLGRLDLYPAFHLELSGKGRPTQSEHPVGFQLVVPLLPGWPADPTSEPFGELSFELAAEELSASVVDVLLHTGGALEERLGSRLSHFVLRLDKRPGEPLAVTLKEGREAAERRLRVTGPRATPRLERLGE